MSFKDYKPGEIPSTGAYNRWDDKPVFRVKASGLTANKKGVLPTDLTPNHKASPYNVNDVVLDIATKKFFSITKVYKDGKCDIGAELGTLA